jgi:small subunit ribosomal protein S16
MALKIRLRQQGKKNRPFFRLVLTESRNPRDGKYIEALGWYNPFETADDKNLMIHGDRVQHWLGLGAVITESVESLLKKSCPGVLAAYKQKKIARQLKAAAKRRGSKKTA